VVDEIPPPEDASFPTEPAAPAAPENPGPRQAALLPAASPGPAPSERPALIADYARHNFEYIRRRIRDKLVYPPRARRTGAQGRAEIVFTIHPDGSVSGVGIGVSSGQDILARAIIDAIYAAAPFPPPPFQAKLAVPITFRLR
jgi:protein TonB